MTGFTRRFLRWWNTRRGIAPELARSVEDYVEETLEAAEPQLGYAAPFPSDATASFPAPTAAMPAGMADAPARRTTHAAPKVAREGSASLEDLLKTLDASFSQTLLQMIDARGLTDSQVYRRAHLSRQHFSKIRGNAAYRPTKATVLALAIALELSLDETRLLLERAGFSLSHASKADVIVEYFIGRRQYDLNLVNRTLYHFDQPILGS